MKFISIDDRAKQLRGFRASGSHVFLFDSRVHSMRFLQWCDKSLIAAYDGGATGNAVHHRVVVLGE